MLLPPAYISAVLNDYKKKLSDGKLHSDLAVGSPARLRDACVRECRRLLLGKDDEKLLREFFEHTGDLGELQNVVRHFDIDKFRPLSKFIRGETISPDDKVVELLAWLIDFKDRPYDYKKKYPEKDNGDSIDDENLGNIVPGDQPTGPTTIEVEAEIKKTNGPYKLIISIVITFAAAWILLYWLQKSKAAGHEACMYWAGDHYEPVSCQKHMENTIVIGLDSEKLVHFRKITRNDTITGLSIGSIWYANYKGEIECYTSPGFHPIDISLRLKPITLYILKKYIWKQNVPGEEDSARSLTR